MAPDPEALRPDRADDAWFGGALASYLLRWDGEYFGFTSNRSPFLVISREIVLHGEINSCDLLVVEGRVEATMRACREIKIVPTGTVRGHAEFDRADIGGVFEGDLTARARLVVRATGRVTGEVRAGEIEIERGGQVTGDVQITS